nr:hypothetical protein BCV09_16560 [Vibrio cyclitrophicus]
MAQQLSFLAPKVSKAHERSEISAKHAVVLQEPAEHEQLARVETKFRVPNNSSSLLIFLIK